MYYLTKIYQKTTEHIPGVEVKHSSEAIDLAHQAMIADTKIVSILVFTDKDTTIIVKRRDKNENPV